MFLQSILPYPNYTGFSETLTELVPLVEEELGHHSKETLLRGDHSPRGQNLPCQSHIQNNPNL